MYRAGHKKYYKIKSLGRYHIIGVLSETPRFLSDFNRMHQLFIGDPQMFIKTIDFNLRPYTFKEDPKLFIRLQTFCFNPQFSSFVFPLKKLGSPMKILRSPTKIFGSPIELQIRWFHPRLQNKLKNKNVIVITWFRVWYLSPPITASGSKYDYIYYFEIIKIYNSYTLPFLLTMILSNK